MKPDYLKIRGTAYDAGRQYGQAMASSIHWSWRYCQYAVFNRRNQKPDPLERIKFLVRETQKRWPLEIEEMAGIADGSGLDFEQVFLINRHLAGTYCSNVAVTHSPHGPIAGGNLDDPKVYFLKDTQITGQYHYVTTAWPGCLGVHNGMNEHGLCMMGSAASPRYTPLTPAPGFHTDAFNVFARVLRSCKNVKEAVQFMSNPEIWGAGNHLLLDAGGDAVIVEKASSTLVSVRKPDKNGFIGSVNYFESECNTEERLKAVDKMNWDRMDAMKRWQAKVDDRNGLAIVRGFLSDTTQTRGDYPVSSWGHTAISSIWMPRRLEFLASDGPPHIAGYYPFNLKESP